MESDKKHHGRVMYSITSRVAKDRLIGRRQTVRLRCKLRSGRSASAECGPFMLGGPVLFLLARLS
jgi:hypothetical protein